MILEGIVTTRNPDETLNVSPMGPLVDDESFEVFTLRPYQTSTTYLNLKDRGAGVLHVTDDVELIARAAVHQLEELPRIRPARNIDCEVLVDACRWYEFEVIDLDDRQERTTIRCRVLHVERQRDFFGFNRAKHAVLETAILATRVHLLPASEIQQQVQHLRVLVEKTAGAQERRAFKLLEEFISANLTVK